MAQPGRSVVTTKSERLVSAKSRDRSPLGAYPRKIAAGTSDFIKMKAKAEQKAAQEEESRSRPQEVIYGADKKLKSALARARQDRINGKTILQLYESMAGNGLAVLTRLSTVERLMQVSKILGKSFQELTEKDWNKLTVRMEKEGYADWTIRSYGKSLRKMLKFLKRGHNYVKRKAPRTSLKAQDLVTPDDFKKMLSKATTPRERAFAMILFESGVRIGELLSLKIGDLQFDKYGAKMQVEGKTGSRTIRLVASYEPLVQYLQHHPSKNKPQAWLWHDTRGGMLKYSAASALLKKLVARACMSKRIYHHLFRHSAASRYAKEMREPVLNGYFGWRNGSKMASVYVHLDTDREVDEAVLEMHGLRKKEEHEPEVLQCPRCSSRNSRAESICKCGFIFDPAVAAAMEKEREDKIEQLDKKFSELQKRLEGLLREPS